MGKRFIDEKTLSWEFLKSKLEETLSWFKFLFRSYSIFTGEIRIYLNARLNSFGFIMLLLGWFDFCRHYNLPGLVLISLVLFYGYLIMSFLKKKAWLFELISYVFYLYVVVYYLTHTIYYNPFVLYLVISFVYYPSKEVCWWFMWSISFFFKRYHIVVQVMIFTIFIVIMLLSIVYSLFIKYFWV